MNFQQYIDGQWTGASNTWDVINPATEEVIGVTADGGAADMDAAIGAARTAFDTTDWSTNVELRVPVKPQTITVTLTVS